MAFPRPELRHSCHFRNENIKKQLLKVATGREFTYVRGEYTKMVYQMAGINQHKSVNIRLFIECGHVD